MRTHTYVIMTAMLCLLVCGTVQAEPVRLTDAVIKAPEHDKTILNAARMLQEEIAQRSGITLPINNANASDTAAVIVVGAVNQMPERFEIPGSATVPETPDGYAVHTDLTTRNAPTLYLVGRDARGALYAVGWFIRQAHIAPGVLELPQAFTLSSAPRYPMRGHQLGFRLFTLVVLGIRCENGTDVRNRGDLREGGRVIDTVSVCLR